MNPVITTLRDRCRRCYACVRHCPSKAIQVRDGQAAVIGERCVSCGRCVGVCSQRAKQVVSHIPGLSALLAAPEPVVAMLAPSFPAAFTEWRPGQLVAALRRVGFAGVHEVAFGADLVSRAYQRLYEDQPDRLLITSPCPASFIYISKYADELVPFLAPVVSPMVAMGRALKQRVRPGCRTVFLGPCIAKLREVEDPCAGEWVDLAMTFPDLRELLSSQGIDPGALPDEPLDPPYSWLGGVYPLPGGLLRAAELEPDILDTRLTTIAGRETFTETIARMREEVQRGTVEQVEARFFDVLFCKGCIGGPAMACGDSLLAKKQHITAFIRERSERPSREEWERSLEELADLDLSREFHADPQPQPVPSPEQLAEVLALTGKLRPEDELNCGACGYHTCREKAIAVIEGLAEVEMCLPYLIDRLQATVEKLNQSHGELQDAQTQLLRAERLASMGQLAAGIAHELNNPLGTILIYSHLLQDSAQGSPQAREDAETILREANRCKTIVGGLLDFARQNKVVRQPVQLRALLEETINLLRVQSADSQVSFVLNVPADLPPANLDPDQMRQVLLNLIRNAVEAMPDGGTVTVSAEWRASAGEFHLGVSDTGPGIAPEHMNKLFSPFFTTKPVGKGTGLGLPICYGIVKMHRGAISARNNADGRGATFEITLPDVPDEHGRPPTDERRPSWPAGGIA